MTEIPDEMVEVLDELAEFIHTCDDTEERAEVCRRLVLVVHALTPIVRLSGVEHPSLVAQDEIADLASQYDRDR